MPVIRGLCTQLVFLFLLVSTQAGTWAAPSSATGEMTILEGRKTATFPIKVLNNLILIPLRINGSVEMDFILDSGARSTVLAEPGLMPLLKISDTKKKRIAGLGERGVYEAEVANDIQIDLPGIRGKNMQLIVLPPDLFSLSEILGRPVYGIIGYDVFKDLIVEIDYERKIIHFTNPRFFRKAPRAYQEIPIEIKNSKPYLPIRIRDYQGTDKTKSLLLDTGSSQAISLSSELIPLPNKHLATFIGTGLSGDIHGDLARIKSINLGGITARQLIACFPNADALLVHQRRQWHGSIGGELLKRFKVIIDYPNQRIFLRKNKKFGAPYLYNISGIETIATGIDYSTIKISYVRPDSPADKAGLLAGDILLRINGIGIEGNGLGEIYNFLNKKRSGKLCVKVKRKDEKLKKCFVLKEIL